MTETTHDSDLEQALPAEWPWRGATESERRRVCACGAKAQLVGFDAGGQVVASLATARRCSSRWCRRCARTRSQAAFASMVRLVGDRDRLVLLTLTLEPPRDAPTERREQAAFMVRLIMDHWRKTAARARTGEVAPPRRRDGRIQRRDRRRQHRATTYRERGWEAASERLTYLAVLQVAGELADRYHAHLHVVCPDIATAELLNAAWQCGRGGWNGKHWHNTDITELPTERAIGYALRYVSRPCDPRNPDELDLEQWETWAEALPVGLYRTRMLNGAGDWRSLRLRRETGNENVQTWRYVDANGTMHTPRQWHCGAGGTDQAPSRRAESTLRALICALAERSETEPNGMARPHGGTPGRVFVLDASSRWADRATLDSDLSHALTDPAHVRSVSETPARCGMPPPDD